MAHLLQLYHPDTLATLWDFNDPTGGGNPQGVRTLLTDFDLGRSQVRTERFESAVESPAVVVADWEDITSSRVLFYPQAPQGGTIDDLIGGLEALARYLRSGFSLRWRPDGAAGARWPQHIDLIEGETLALWRGQNYLAQITGQLHDPEGIELELARYPLLREAEKTIGPITVSNNPAATNGRMMSVDIDSSAPTPARVTVKAGTGAKLTSILAASRAMLPVNAADYVDTHFAQCQSSGGGWTVVLTGGTTSQADANASGGNAAQTSYASNPTVMQKRVRITRTTKLDSLRGRWDVYVRLKANNAARHEIQLRWSPSLADPATNTEERVPKPDTTGLSSFDYEVKRLGTIEIPEKGTLGGLALELWSRRVSGTGTLNWDYVWLVPADRAALITVPGDAEDFWQGKDIVSPPHKLASDPTWTAGAYGGGILSLRAANEGGGTPPNTGLGIGTGRNRVSFRLTRVNFIGTVKWRVVNVTDGTEVAAGSVSPTNGASVTRTPALEFDSVAGKLYQFQAVLTAASQGRVDVERIDHSFVPVLEAGEQVHADPEAGRVDRLNAAGAHLNPLTHAGPVPFVLEPDTNVLAFGLGDVPLPGYAEDRDVLDRTADVTITYAPRRYV